MFYFWDFQPSSSPHSQLTLFRVANTDSGRTLRSRLDTFPNTPTNQICCKEPLLRFDCCRDRSSKDCKWIASILSSSEDSLVNGQSDSFIMSSEFRHTLHSSVTHFGTDVSMQVKECIPILTNSPAHLLAEFSAHKSSDTRWKTWDSFPERGYWTCTLAVPDIMSKLLNRIPETIS